MGCAVADLAPTVGLTYIMDQLGQGHHDARWQVRYVNLLIADRGFPRPLPAMRRGTLTDAVTTHSRWQRFAVDQWFEDFLPPEAAAAQETARQSAANDDMDEAAADIAAAAAARRRGGQRVGVSA